MIALIVRAIRQYWGGNYVQLVHVQVAFCFHTCTESSDVLRNHKAFWQRPKSTTLLEIPSEIVDVVRKFQDFSKGVVVEKLDLGGPFSDALGRTTHQTFQVN